MAELRGRKLVAVVVAAVTTAVALSAVAACGGTPGPTTPPRDLDPQATTTTDSFVGVARSVVSIGHPALVARLRRDPFSFFRYLAGPFVAATCEGMSEATERMPVVNLHGDAHLEQYAVAEDGRGLADFDAATTGPYVVDLVRFATSLRLAARVRGLPAGAADAAITRFLAGYRAALRVPKIRAPEPRVVARVRQRFAPSTAAWLDRVERMMTPPDDATRATVRGANASFVDAMRKQNPDLAPAFFDIRSLGVLRMGVGSVNEKKFLARVAGATTAPDDDVIYEVKEVARIEPGTCVAGDPERDPSRVIRGQARLSGVHQRFLGFVEMDGRKFYVHTWRVNYTELDVDDIAVALDLAEVAYDVGVQLGRGHPAEMAEAAEGPLAPAILASLDRVEPSLRELAGALEDRSVAGWRVLVGEEPELAR